MNTKEYPWTEDNLGNRRHYLEIVKAREFALFGAGVLLVLHLKREAVVLQVPSCGRLNLVALNVLLRVPPLFLNYVMLLSHFPRSTFPSRKRYFVDSARTSVLSSLCVFKITLVVLC